MVLDGLKPERVFQIFEEITQIPHGSGNVGMISSYLVEFAKRHDLWYRQDDMMNVIIKKPASDSSYVNPVILQGHIDMVAVKTIDKVKQLDSEGLDIMIEGDYITADGTTLGGDDGIAVAYILALLESDDIVHPPLEAVFTVDEEIGMLGADAIDLSELNGKMMLNIDSEEEGIFLSGCAGGATLSCTYPMSRCRIAGNLITLNINGLTGGHSGMDIVHQRANANVVLGRLLFMLSRNYEFAVVSIGGGEKDNVIAGFSRAEIITETNIGSIIGIIDEYSSIIRNEYAITDPKLNITYKIYENEEREAFSKDETDRIIRIFTLVPDGVIKMSNDIKGLVQSSLNLGIVTSTDTSIQMNYLIRSSVESEKEYLIERICMICEMLHGSYSITGVYPAWEYIRNSALRDVMSEAYFKLYGKKPQIMTIHAGVECGIMTSKIDGLDCISFGPDILDIHTVNERLSISSVKRTWELILEVLKLLK